MREHMIIVGCAIVLTTTCTIAPRLSVAEDSLPADLRSCSVIEDTTTRLSCFDMYVGRSTPAEESPTAAVHAQSQKAPVEPTPRIEKLPDDFGSESLPQEARGDVEKRSVRAMVTRCQKDARGKYLFFFDNGHIWKQSNTKKLRFEECEFEVTITEDVFGYKMQRVGEKTKIRITRVR